MFLTPQRAALLAGAARGDRPVRPRHYATDNTHIATVACEHFCIRFGALSIIVFSHRTAY